MDVLRAFRVYWCALRENKEGVSMGKQQAVNFITNNG